MDRPRKTSRAEATEQVICQMRLTEEVNRLQSAEQIAWQEEQQRRLTSEGIDLRAAIYASKHSLLERTTTDRALAIEKMLCEIESQPVKRSDVW